MAHAHTESATGWQALRIRLGKPGFEVVSACSQSVSSTDSAGLFSERCQHDLAVEDLEATGWVLLVVVDAVADVHRARSSLLAANPSVGEILDRLIICDDRWWSALCEDQQCCPPEGSEVLAWPPADRAKESDDVSECAPPSWLADLGTAGADACAAFARQVDELAPSLVEAQSFEARLELIDRIDADVAGNNVDASTLAAFNDVRLRDGLLRRWVFESASEHRLMIESALIGAARSLPPERSCPLLTVIAGIAWSRGEPVVARHCVQAALQHDPHYSLARLLQRALMHQVPARVWLQAVEATSMRECLVGAGS